VPSYWALQLQLLQLGNVAITSVYLQVLENIVWSPHSPAEVDGKQQALNLLQALIYAAVAQGRSLLNDNP
jgi:hypothetical protein